MRIYPTTELRKAVLLSLTFLMLGQPMSWAQNPNDAPVGTACQGAAAGSTSSSSPSSSSSAQSSAASPTISLPPGPGSLQAAPPLRPALGFSFPTQKKSGKPRIDPYAHEEEIQSKSQPLGSAPVEPVSATGAQSPSLTEQLPDTSMANTVLLSRPPLQALISVEGSLNPFTLDAHNIEPVKLRDVLLAAEHGNLDILSTRYGANAQKYTYLSALSQFLPDITLGYNKMLVNAYVPIPIKAVIAQSSTGQAGATGGTVNPATLATILNTPITQLTSGFTVPIFQSSIIYTSMAERHRLLASRAQLVGSVNDALLTAARDYYNLLLNLALLQIRTKAVERSQEQFRMNTTLESSGLATNLDILQARAQLARDQQDLIDQQRQRRNSAIQLAHVLNANLGQDLVPSDELLRKVRLVSNAMSIADLLRVAVDNRPELKQYDQLRQAAKAAILSATAPLTPTVTLGGNIYGVGVNLGSLGPVYLLNFGVKWTIGGLGTTDLANTAGAKWRARQAVVDANKQFVDVFEQVRTTYNDSLSAERRIDRAIDEITAAEEELRLSRIRLETGLGINIDVLNAQRDLTQANVNKAQAISDFNTAQVQLVHDIGLISVDNLTSGRLISSAAINPVR